MTASLRATGPADILSFVPHALGKVPSESFVFLSLQGTKLGATLRVDAPSTSEPFAFAHAMRDYLGVDMTATGALLVIYTEQTGPGRAAPVPRIR